MLLLLALALAAQTSDSLRVSGWQRDLEFLRTEARRLHAGPARPAHGPEFGIAIERLSRRIPSLSDQRVAVEIQRVLALLGDGHSILYLMPTARVPLTRLPFELYWFSDGVHVVEGVRDGQALVGNRVIRIGGQPVEGLLTRLEPYVSRDNRMAFRTFGPFYLTVPAFLEAVGVNQPDNRLELELADREGMTRAVTVAAGPMRRPRRKLAAPAGVTSPAPMYLQRVETAWWVQRLPDHQALYFQFNQVMDGDRESLAGFAGRLRDSLAAGTVTSAIVDVRHNNGGNNMLLAPLVETLAAFERSRPGNRIYVLTSRTTFSAAQNFITRLERAARPFFAGESSMSSPNFTGEDNPVTLPWSGLQLSISNRYWQDSEAGDRRPAIPMDLPVDLTARAWLSNQDPVLERVLREIRSRQ